MIFRSACEETVRLEDSRDFVIACGLPDTALIVASLHHDMVDPDALSAVRRKPDPGSTLRDPQRLIEGRLDGAGARFD